MKEFDLESEVKSLLWSMGNQREKVEGKLKTIVNEIYEIDDESKEHIIEKIMFNFDYSFVSFQMRDILESK